MIKKNIGHGLLVGLLLILGAIFVSGAVTITINTPTTSSYTAGDITVNATWTSETGGTNASNVTTVWLNISNSAGTVVLNQTATGFNLSNYTYVWDADNGTFSDGKYRVNISTYDTNDSSVNMTSNLIYIDNTKPIIDLIYPTGNLLYNHSSIRFNFTARDANLSNCSLYGNFNGTWALIQTNTSAVSNNSQFNFTNVTLSDTANSKWNVRCYDLSTNSAENKSNFTLKIDTTNPASKITIKNEDGDSIASTKEIDFGSTTTIDCGASDATSGVNTLRNFIAVKYPGVSYYKNITPTTNQVTALKGALAAEDTSFLGAFSVRCTVADNTNFTNVTYFNFTVINTLLGGSGTAAIPGWENPVGTKKILSGVYVAKEALDTTGMSRLMLPGAGIELDIKGETHTVTVESMTAEEVVLTITSDPMEVTIKTGETGSYDLNGDGVDDLAITYHKEFVKTYADLTFALTEEPAAEPIEDVEEAPSEFEGETGAEEYVSPKGGLTITLAVIVIILIIGFALIKGKKK